MHVSNNFASFLALLDVVSRAPVVAQVSVVRASSVRPLTEVSQKLLGGSRSNFMESYLSTISPGVFFFFTQKFQFSQFLRFFVVNMGPHGSKKRYFYNLHPI